jgi:hypothetical protein
MAAVLKTRHLLRGKIRTQCQYTILLLERLVKAYTTSGEVLPIATGLSAGSCPVTYYTSIILQLQTGLAEKG